MLQEPCPIMMVKKDGDYAFYFQDGSKKEEGSWKNDKRDGLWVQNLKNGNKKKRW